LVAHTGFEPVISALRGQRPKPLDECALKITLESLWPPGNRYYINTFD
jgi:hypothetical protein